MKLYDCQMAPNPRRARIFIAEKGLAIPNVEVSILEGANLKPEYLAINPWGTLPALQLDDGTVIAERRKPGWTPAPTVHLADFPRQTSIRG